MKTRRIAVAALALALLMVGAAACDQKGPDPTEASVTALAGPYAVETATVPAGNGFGGGTIYYPTATNQGRYGAVAVVPGFLMPQSTMSWYGPRVASQGFVVFTIDTNSVYDTPALRSTELLAALDWLTTSSTVTDRVDPNRLAVMGWSMGGGGALRAGVTRPTLKATIALAPWNDTPDFSEASVPALVVACQSDTIAPVSQHASPIYDSIPVAVAKEYVEIAGADHFCVTSNNTNETQRAAIARQVISFLKRFVDSDTRYSQFLCPPPAVGTVISDTRATCEF